MPSLPPHTRSVAFLAAAHALAFAATDSGLNLPSRLGEAMGSVVFACALVSVVMAWRRSTRRHIPLATLLVVVFTLFSPDSTRESDRRSMEADLAAMRGALEDPASAPKLASDAPWPSGSDARGLRAGRMIIQDQLGWMQSLAGSYRVGPGTEPEAWLSPAYLADAGRHPEVGDYYARYRDYTGRVAREFAPHFDSLANLHLEEAALSASGRRGYLSGIRGAMASRGAAFQAVETLCRDAVELHAFLVRVDPRVHLDPDGTTARFEDPRELEHAQTLIAALQAGAAALERTSGQRGAAFDSIRSVLLPTPKPAAGGL